MPRFPGFFLSGRVSHVRGAERLSVLVQLVGEESRERRSGRDWR
jgi:hypothetical protein